MNIGLFFGSFNPIHVGHLIVADAMIETVGFDEVWMVVSPLNPFKIQRDLAMEDDRLAMVELAVASHPRIKASRVEFDLPKPSYTIDTLDVLMKQYPEADFSIIMGTDNLTQFHRWKAYERILDLVCIEVYDRKTDAHIPMEFRHHDRIAFRHFPLVDVSSTMLRRKVNQGESIRYWVLPEVETYIHEHLLYRSDN